MSHGTFVFVTSNHVPTVCVWHERVFVLGTLGRWALHFAGGRRAALYETTEKGSCIATGLCLPGLLAMGAGLELILVTWEFVL